MPEPDCPSPADLSGFVLGTLAETALERIARHLDGCPACEAAVNSLEHVSDPVLAAIRGPAHRPTDAGGPPLPERLGDFRILREVGRGGMGIVYEAEQVSLGRRVALKVLPRHALLDRQAVERFRREARAAARLHHTNIVPVFGTGEQDGLHYFVMQFIPGSGLDRIVAELRHLRGRTPTSPGPDGSPAASVQGLLSGRFDTGAGEEAAPGPAAPEVPPGDTIDSSGRTYWVSVARLGLQVAEALAFAHAQGVVHRDIKPSNLLLDPGGRLWVTDFGLAKEAASPEDLTRSGFLLGTLRYVPPERFRGPCDARGDVYGLGLTLYELLTLRPAFDEADRSKLLHQVMHAEPPRPRKLSPAVPRDLETIVLKAIARDPAHRYPTAAAFADDLRRFVEDRPIRARRVTAAERLWRAARRDPVRAGLLAGLLLACVAGVAGVTTQWWAESRARQAAERAEGQARQNLYFARLAQARLEWQLNNVTEAEELLERCEPGLRGWEWDYLRGLNRADLFPFPEPDRDLLFGIAFSPDGRYLAFTGWDPFRPREKGPAEAVEVWDLQTGRRLPAPGGHKAGLRVSFSPDGHLLAAGDETGTVRVWRPATGEAVASWHAGGTPAFSPDGRLLATGGAREVVFWDPASGRRVRSFPSGGGRVTFSPDGKYLAVSDLRRVELRDAATGREVRRLVPPEAVSNERRYFPDEGLSVAFSPDGRLLAVATDPPHVWDTGTGLVVHTLARHTGRVNGVAFGPDGHHVATAGADGTVRVWDARTGGERSVRRGHRAAAGCVCFHPGGWCLASGGNRPGDVKLWDLTRNPEYITLPPVAAEALVFEPGGARLVVANHWGSLRVLEIATGHTLSQTVTDMTLRPMSPACPAAFSADGRRLAVVGSGRRVVKVLEAPGGRDLRALSGLGADGVHVALSADGGRVAAAGRGAGKDRTVREVRVWDAGDGRSLAAFRPAAPARLFPGAVALSPDGTRVAFDDYAEGRARLRLAEADGGRELLSLPLGSTPVFWVTFSPDGRRLAAVDEEGDVRVWESATGRALHERPLRGPEFRLAFSPDGRLLAAANREQLKVWDVEGGRAVLVLRGAPPRPADGASNPPLAWSPDGRRLAAANWDGTVSVWDAWREAPPGPAALRAVADGRAYRWHLDEAAAALTAGHPAAALFHLERVRGREPPDAGTARRRGRLLLRWGAAGQAAADYARALAAESPSDWAGLLHARALLAHGDGRGYRGLCARLLARPEPKRDWDWVVYAVRACMLGPDGVTDPAELVRAVEEELGHRPRDPNVLFSRGLLHYRAGQWAQAAERLEQSAASSPEGAWLRWPVLAMAHHRLGHAEEARRWLALAKARHEEVVGRRGEGTGGLSLPEDWPEFEILYAEARGLVGGGKR